LMARLPQQHMNQVASKLAQPKTSHLNASTMTDLPLVAKRQRCTELLFTEHTASQTKTLDKKLWKFSRM
jgi:hypothetical protein